MKENLITTFLPIAWLSLSQLSTQESFWMGRKGRDRTKKCVTITSSLYVYMKSAM